MNQAPVGTHIRVMRNSNSHDYTIGQIYRVSNVDTDGTFKATNLKTGNEGNWLRWGDCEPVATIGWDLCQKVLPKESVSFLRAFDRIDLITLKSEVKDHILMKLPDLYEQVLEAAAEIELNSLASDDDDDEDDDDDDDNDLF